MGINGYNDIIRQMREYGISLPLIAIGGIEYDDIEILLSTGVNGIALSSSVLNADDPVKEMRRIVELMNNKQQIL